MTRKVGQPTARGSQGGACALALLAGLASAGCRDVVFDGQRISDQHILKGRAGSPVLTGTEIREHRFVSRTSDLTALRDTLRSHVGGTLSVYGNLDVQTAGMVMRFDPTRGPGLDYPSDPRTLGRAFGSIPLSGIRDEYRTLCEDPFLSQVFKPVGPDADPCNVVKLDDLERYVAFLAFSVRSADITANWVAPSAALNERRFYANADDPPGTCGDCSLGFHCPLGPTDTPDPTRACVWDAVFCGDDARLCSFDPRGTDGVVDPYDRTDGDCETLFRHTCETTVHTYLDQDASLSAPVLELTVPMDVGMLELPSWLGLFSVDVTYVEAKYRLQPVVGAAATRTREGPYFSAYRGASPLGDLAFSDADVDVHAVGVRGDARVSVVPTGGAPLCFLFGACYVIAEDIRDKVVRALDRGVRSTGRMLDLFVSAPPLALGGNLSVDALSDACRQLLGIREDCSPEDCCPISREALGQLAKHGTADLGLSSVRLPELDAAGLPQYAALGAAGGLWTNDTIDVFRGGGDVVSATLDLSAFASVCSPEPGGFDTQCATTPRDERCVVCDECTRFGGLIPEVDRLCTFETPYLLAVDGPRSRSHTASLVHIPASPALATLIDAMPNVAAEVRGVFSGPLDEYHSRSGARVRYTSARYCGPTDLDGICTDRIPGAAFGIDVTPDADLDGVLDPDDNCPHDWNRDQANCDDDPIGVRDPFGDACDLCPGVAGGSNRDTDGDGAGDVCDCDADGDGCNNSLAGTALRTDCAPTPFGCAANGDPGTDPFRPRFYFDEYPLGCDETARDGTCVNTDADVAGGDAWIDDCDRDDDADGVPDDGRGDGIDVVSPCGIFGPPCDDNCEDAANPDQSDLNEDGVGDECDLLCGTASSRPFCTSGGSAGPFERGGVFGEGILPEPECLTDGPGCWGWGVAGCSAALPVGCGTDYEYLDVFRATDSARVRRFSIAGERLGGAVALIPDIDGDGLTEAVLGAPAALSPLDPNGPPRALAGEVAAIASRDGKELWRLAPAPAGARFGTSIVVVGATLFVGAPGATDPGGRATGAVYRYVVGHGAPAFEEAIYGDAPGDELGASLTIVGDAPVAGFTAGVLVGAPGADALRRPDAGRLYGLDVTGARVVTFNGPIAGARLGQVATALLPNAFKLDGGGGVIAGLPDLFGGRGAVARYGWDGGLRWLVAGRTGEHLGSSLSHAADFDGDRHAEVAVGAPGAFRGAGAVYVANFTGGLTGILSGGPGDALGTNVAAPGDLDRDGAFDLVVALSGHDLAGGTGRGAWFVLSAAGGQNPNLPPPTDAPAP